MPFPFGYLLTLKLFPILGDILIGILLYYFAARIKGVSHPIIYPIIYLLSPFSWYISSLWGQTDQLSFLLTFISFFLLPRSFVPAVILFYLGVSLKPTSLFLAPMFLYLTLRFRPKKISLLVGLLACLALTVFIFGQFTHKNFLDFFIHNLYPRLADRPNRLTTNAYNFWHIFTLDRSVDSQLPFILITGNILGYIFYIILNLFSFRYLKKISPSTLITSFFIISFGSWLFLTNMLDRYAFAGVASGLFLTLYHPKTLKYWLPLSIIFWLNLFRGWWFPTLLSPIKYLLTFSHFLIGLPLSIANVFAYFRLIPPPSSILHPKA
jgi:Gpi18-like mannosyltransferase